MSKLKIFIRSLLPNFIIDNYRQNKKAKVNKNLDQQRISGKGLSKNDLKDIFFKISS